MAQSMGEDRRDLARNHSIRCLERIPSDTNQCSREEMIQPDSEPCIQVVLRTNILEEALDLAACFA